MEINNKILEIIKDNLESFMFAFDSVYTIRNIDEQVKHYKETKNPDLVINYEEVDRDEDNYVFDYPMSSLFSLLDDNVKYFNIHLLHEYRFEDAGEILVDNFIIKVPLSYLLTKDFNWEGCYFKVKDSDYDVIWDSELNIELCKDKGKEVIDLI